MADSLALSPLPGGGFDWSLRALHGLVLRATIDPQSPVLAEFYAGYDKAFVLPREREELQGFRDCLALGAGPAFEELSARYGPFREVVLTAADAATGAAVGGANFIAFPLPGLAADDGRPIVSMNLNYIFIGAEFRGQGLFRRLLAAIRDMAQGLVIAPGGAALLTFIEQNDPFRLSPEDYARDTAHSGLDQVSRLAIWQRLGAKIVDYPYVQPALSPGQAPDDGLLYGVLGAAGDRLDACVLEAHLRRFFGISVLKGRPLGEDPIAGAQIAALRRACAGGEHIRLLDAAPGLVAAARNPEPRPASFLDILRKPD